MKYLIISNGYPSENNLYNNAFIHRRVKSYNSSDVSIFVLNENISTTKSYIYDDVQVTEGNTNELKYILDKQKPKKVLVHFINILMMRALEEAKYKGDILVWIHGVEGLGWYRRLFNFEFRTFLKYMYNNQKQRKTLRNFTKRYVKQLHFIFVSNWMKDVFKSDVYNGNIKFSIIPNTIDSDLYTFESKPIEQRKRILLIRPFASKKYANDLAIDSILELSKKDYFHELEFLIVGEGKYYETLTSKVQEFSNVKLVNSFLTQGEMAIIHKEYGIFLCPTRQDAQGVSMCEAMSSGLIPITSLNTAIPEFVTNEVSGFLTKNAKEITQSIETIYYNPELFHEMSLNATKEIQLKCSNEATIEKEWELIDDK